MKHLFLWHKIKTDLVKEMDSELQMPGWGNIWTQPIINRVDMLATGVRTMIGVKVFGPRQEDLTEEVVENGVDEDGRQGAGHPDASPTRSPPCCGGVRGAVDVFPDQIVGRSYLQIDIDREKAARYGVNVARHPGGHRGGHGRQDDHHDGRGPPAVPRPRPLRPRLLADAGGAATDRWSPAGGADAPDGRRRQAAMSGRGGMGWPADAAGELAAGGQTVQIPITEVADIQVVEGPSVIKSENGMLRSYVQLNVRDRDIVGFVEEAQRAVGRARSSCRRASTSSGPASSSTRSGPARRCRSSSRWSSC